MVPIQCILGVQSTFWVIVALNRTLVLEKSGQNQIQRFLFPVLMLWLPVVNPWFMSLLLSLEKKIHTYMHTYNC